MLGGRTEERAGALVGAGVVDVAKQHLEEDRSVVGIVSANDRLAVEHELTLGKTVPGVAGQPQGLLPGDQPGIGRVVNDHLVLTGGLGEIEGGVGGRPADVSACPGNAR